MSKPKNNGKSWSKEDDRQLKKLAKEKKPLEKIAKSLKRSEAATRQRAAQKKVSLKPND